MSTAVVVRRRRRFAGLVLTLCGAAAVALLIPVLHREVRDLTLPLQDASIIRQQAREKNLDPALIAAVIFAETKFSPSTSTATTATRCSRWRPTTAVRRTSTRGSRRPGAAGSR
jgi:soluble lytic murein transglycosylase